MKANVYNIAGEVVRTEELEPKIFGVTMNPSVIKRAVMAQDANSRVAIAHTKTKAEVQGGGRKPWKQKGTGRARQGSIRSPQWKGGGIVFGPRSERNFTLRINKKELRKALFMSLSAKAGDDKLVLLDDLALADHKTKTLVGIVSKLPVDGRKKFLLVQPVVDRNIQRAAKNIPHVQTILANSINLNDVLKHEYLLMPVSALEVLRTTFLRKA